MYQGVQSTLDTGFPTDREEVGENRGRPKKNTEAIIGKEKDVADGV